MNPQCPEVRVLLFVNLLVMATLTGCRRDAQVLVALDGAEETDHPFDAACPLEVDVIGDGMVDVLDLGFISTCLGSPLLPSDGGCACCPADVDCDGSVTEADLSVVTCVIRRGGP